MSIKSSKHLIILCFCLYSFILSAKAQSDSLSDSTNNFNKARLTGIIIGGSALYAGSMTGLYHLWYKDFPQGKLHFNNDNEEWLLMDKTGHATASYYIGLLGYESLKWAGLSEKKSTWYGGSLGFVYLTVIEILDGHSVGWGASPGDLIANGTGTAIFIGQQLKWKEQRIVMKWSFHLTDYAQYNPGQLGNGFASRMMKDYNGQTIWLSGNIGSFIRKNNQFPEWFNLALGYGAEGMTGARSNPEIINGVQIPQFERHRQFYIAPDIDLSRIKTRNQTLNYALKALGFIKFPLPALEINKKGLKFHPIYF
ncbi:MAG: YfiM family protein [Lentimicrobium sp.]|nr:YfiM family protein [Lentimicrobium sp.]